MNGVKLLVARRRTQSFPFCCGLSQDIQELPPGVTGAIAVIDFEGDRVQV